MKTALAALSVLAATMLLSGPAAAFDRFADRSDALVEVRDHGWGDGEGWRDRGDWRGHRDWRERRDWGDRRDERGDMLSEGQVARRLMRQGFVRIDDIDRRRDRYIVRAVRPNGALIRLAVDAYDGDIVAREQVGWVAEGRGYDRRYRQPANGVEFDLGGGTLGIYSR